MQQERIRISERTKAGLAKARATGKPVGRPWKVFAHGRVAADRQRGMSWRQLERKYHVAQSTLRHCLRKLAEAHHHCRIQTLRRRWPLRETSERIGPTGGRRVGKLKALALDSVTSPHSRRAYASALDNFLAWYRAASGAPLSKAVVHAYKAHLEAAGLSASTINSRLCALRKLVSEAADNGLIPQELAAGIARVRGVGQRGVRLGNWPDRRQAERLIQAPNAVTLTGQRDRALFAVLIGCGLRRSEAVGLTFAHIQQRQQRWVIVDLLGKHGRVRSVPMPGWAKAAIHCWSAAADIHSGRVFRPINRGGRIRAAWHQATGGRSGVRAGDAERVDSAEGDGRVT